MLTVLFLTASALLGAPQLGPPAPAPIDEQVLAELLADPEQRAFVVVLLTPVAPGSRAQLGRQMQAVAEVQERVLGRAPADFELRHRYRTFAAFTGRVDAAALSALAADPDVVAIGADGRMHGGSLLDTSVGYVNADAVHALGLTGEGVTVAVIDSGIDTDHVDLADDLAPGARHFLDQGADVGPGAEDAHGHGTNVSGIVTSAGNNVPPGVAPDAAILAVRVLDANNNGWLSVSIAGFDYVTTVAGSDLSLRVVNMSLGSDMLFSSCPCDASGATNQAFHAATLAARTAGLAIFASSGNEGSCGSMTSPACLSSVVAVAAVYEADLGREPDAGTYSIFGGSFASCFDATTAADRITCFSNRSPCNELAAPGRNIRSTGRGGGQSIFTGTSQAAPHCSAIAALMATAEDMTPERVLQLMKGTGHPTTAPCGATPNPVRVDALAAVQAAFETSFCNAFDGALASCPCGNAGAPETGCDLQQGTGGVRLSLLAQETAPENRATVLGAGYPSASTPAAVVIRSASPTAPTVFGDGLRCVGVPLVRLGATLTLFGFARHTFGHGAMSGAGDFHYQIWFRNTPAAFCTPDAFNLSNGRTLTW